MTEEEKLRPSPSPHRHLMRRDMWVNEREARWYRASDLENYGRAIRGGEGGGGDKSYGLSVGSPPVDFAGSTIALCVCVELARELPRAKIALAEARPSKKSPPVPISPRRDRGAAIATPPSSRSDNSRRNPEDFAPTV